MCPQLDDNYADEMAALQQSQGWLNILASFARFVQPAVGSRLLDIGTGGGALVNHFYEAYGAWAVGLDANPHLIDYILRQNPTSHVSYVIGGVYDLPFAENTWDIITATNVIYLLDDPVRALSEIRRVLRPEGRFVMLNPTPAMTRVAMTALADERGLQGADRAQVLHWADVAEARGGWSVADVENLFTQANLKLISTQLRIGSGFALYAMAKRRD
jgi:SAM-dependent methyltransferase